MYDVQNKYSATQARLGRTEFRDAIRTWAEFREWAELSNAIEHDWDRGGETKRDKRIKLGVAILMV